MRTITIVEKRCLVPGILREGAVTDFLSLRLGPKNRLVLTGAVEQAEQFATEAAARRRLIRVQMLGVDWIDTDALRVLRADVRIELIDAG